MYKYEFLGCFSSVLILMCIGILIKELWWLIVGIAIVLIVLYYAKLIYNLFLQKQQEKDANYTPEMGEVYKECPYCNTKVSVTAVQCPVCKHELN